MSNDAPGSLRLVQDFANTVDVEAGDDDFASPAQASTWLASHGLLPHGALLDDESHGRVLAFRQAIRDTLVAHHDGHPDPFAALVPFADEAPVRISFLDAGPNLVPVAGGVAGAMGRLLGAVYDAIAAGSWERLKICRMDSCAWAFYDASKNRSGAWCSMRVCGNRAKVRAYQQRRRQAR